MTESDSCDSGFLFVSLFPFGFLAFHSFIVTSCTVGGTAGDTPPRVSLNLSFTANIARLERVACDWLRLERVACDWLRLERVACDWPRLSWLLERYISFDINVAG